MDIFAGDDAGQAEDEAEATHRHRVRPAPQEAVSSARIPHSDPRSTTTMMPPQVLTVVWIDVANDSEVAGGGLVALIRVGNVELSAAGSVSVWA